MDEIPIFLGNIQISVKFEITTSQLAQAVNIMKKHAETPKQIPQANKPYRTKEGFRVCKVSAENPVRLETRTYRVWDRGYYLS